MSLRNLSYAFLLALLHGICHAEDDSNAQRLLFHLESENYKEVVSLADSILVTQSSNLARICLIKADAEYYLGDLNKSLISYLKAIELSKTYPMDRIHLTQAYSHTGFCFKYLGRNRQAIPYYHEALDLSRNLHDSVEIANQLSSLGNLYASIGQYDLAGKYHNECYQIDFLRQDKVALAYDLTSLGDLKCQIGDLEEAITCYKQALKVRETIGNNYSTYSIRLGKLGEAYLETGQLDSADFYINLAIKYAEERHDSLTIAKQWIVLTKIQYQRGQTKKALNTGARALVYFSKSAENQYQVSAEIALANVYFELGDHTKTTNLLDEAARIAEANGLFEELSKIYQQRVEVAEKQKNTTLALEYYKKYQTIQDTLVFHDKQNAILALDLEYKTAKKEQKIKLLTTQNELASLSLIKKKREQYVMIISVVLILMMAGFVGYIFYMRSTLNERILSQEIENLRLNINSLVKGSSDGLEIDADQLNKRLITPLTEREFEILMLAVSDKKNSEIAEEIFVSVNTVKYHLKNIYEKLGVSNRKEALQFAINPNKS